MNGLDPLNPARQWTAQRKFDTEYAAVGVGFLQPDPPVMEARDPLSDRESQTRATPRSGLPSGMRLVGSKEAVEDVWLVLGGNPASGISHTYAEGAVDHAHRRFDAPPGIRVLHGIVEQNEQQLP